MRIPRYGGKIAAYYLSSVLQQLHRHRLIITDTRICFILPLSLSLYLFPPRTHADPDINLRTLINEPKSLIDLRIQNNISGLSAFCRR